MTLTINTVRDARDDRLLGVAGEIAFFALLAIPPLMLVLAGSAGFVGNLLGHDVRRSLQESLLRGLGGFLAPETMRDFAQPAVESMFARGRGGIVSIGALLAVWSASRLVKVLIEAMNVAYDVGEWRPAWKRRLIAIGLTVGGIVSLGVLLPFVVAGPGLGHAIGERFGVGGVIGPAWAVLYWPVAVAVGVSMLATLYHIAPNHSTPWRRDLPGAVLAGLIWLAAAFGLRLYLDVTITDSAFGPLGAPIAVLLWLYVSALAVLLGAELNGEIERVWPTSDVAHGPDV